MERREEGRKERERQGRNEGRKERNDILTGTMVATRVTNNFLIGFKILSISGNSCPVL